MTMFSKKQKIQNYFANKYTLKERLNKLTRDEYRSALRVLPQALKISQRTFYRYMNTKIVESYSIPSDDLARLARYFNCNVELQHSYNYYKRENRC